MKRNLISLSTLDSEGYRYHTRRGVLTVCRGSSTAMKGDLVRGQYLLRESAVSGEAMAVGAESCDHHLTLVRHRQLGRRNETEMQDRNGGTLNASSEYGSGHGMTLRDVSFPTVWGFSLRGGKEAFSTIAAWRTRVKGQRRVSVDRLQAGNVFERCVKGMFVICSTEGIVIHRTDAWKSPRLDGTAEHIRDVPCDRAQDVLSHVRAEALDTASFLGEVPPSMAIMCRGSFAGLVGSSIGNSHWMRA